MQRESSSAAYVAVPVDLRTMQARPRVWHTDCAGMVGGNQGTRKQTDLAACVQTSGSGFWPSAEMPRKRTPQIASAKEAKEVHEDCSSDGQDEGTLSCHGRTHSRLLRGIV